MSHYLYQTSDTEIQRLLTLNRLYNPYSQQGLNHFIKSNATILELGSGLGIMGQWFAQKIGASGFYQGLDQDVKHLTFVQKNLSQCKNAKFILADITDFSFIKTLPTASIDIIYCRWVLAHVPSNLRIESLCHWLPLLKKGGYFICEEADISTTQVHSETHFENDVIDDWKMLSHLLANQLELDFELSEHRLKILFEKAFDKTPITIQHPAPCLTCYEEKIILAQALHAARDVFVKIISDKKTLATYDYTLKRLKNMANQRHITVSYLANCMAIHQAT